MRKSTDVCLLCQANQAQKTNSHILPRFISTSFLGGKGQPRRGYSLGGDKPKVIQDSPKEDFILCNECEAYFSILEGQSAGALRDWRDKVTSGEYGKELIGGFLPVISLQTADPQIIRLLVYSMFWRASISDHDMFVGYVLTPALEDGLRQELLIYKSASMAELSQKLVQRQVTVYPYSIVTADTFKDGTANVLAAIGQDPYSLNVDQFGFLLFENEDKIKHAFTYEHSNVKTADCKIMVLTEDLWHSVMVEMPLKIIVDQERERLK